MVMLMIIYGMFIPNTVQTTAKVVLSMALVQLVVLALAIEHSDAASRRGPVQNGRAVWDDHPVLDDRRVLPATYGSFLF